MFDFNEKTVLITGASYGLGEQFAYAFAECGADLILTARSTDLLESVGEQCRSHGNKVTVVPGDVSIEADVENVIATGLEAHEKIDVLINNAGVEAGAKTYSMIDEDDWDYVLDTNLKSAWRLSKMYTDAVVESDQEGGNIINIASITAYRTIKGQFPYAVSKAALVKATEVMALEGARYGIRINALAPGYILTNVSRLLLESERSESFVKGIPMRRYGEFDDLDGPLLLLASDGSRYMTGSVVVVDGGHICSEL